MATVNMTCKMKHLSQAVVSSALIFVSLVCSDRLKAEEQQATTSVPPIAEGFVPIFNGKNLSGWTGHTDGYHVEDGILVCKAGGLLLFTETQYTDFVLRFDFQLTPGANSGIGIRYAPPFQPLQDIEIQILDNSAKEYKDLDGKHRHGAIYSVAAAKPGHLRRVGQWNSQTIAVQGSRITVTLNGEVILDKRLDEFNLHPDMQRPRGHIAILGHGTPMKFRKIGVKELTAE